MADPLTITDALAASLRTWLLANRPEAIADTGDWPDSRFVLRFEDDDLPAPRVQFHGSEPVFQRGMIGTARVAGEIVLSTPLATVSAASHLAIAAAIDAALRELEGTLPAELEHVFLHALDVLHPVTSTDENGREQRTTHRLSAVCTLLVPEEEEAEPS